LAPEVGGPWGRLGESAARVAGSPWLFATVVLGIVGALVGGFLGHLIGFGDLSGFDLRSMALAVGGAIVVLFLYGLATKGAH
jgi:uncharacterized membrane protein YeaQ/YmgE (transglycosylase-associated protein family)